MDESAITGESAPVIREAGGDRSAVTGGTRVLSDWVKVKITSNPGETFLDRMIALVEGAELAEDSGKCVEHPACWADDCFSSGCGHAATVRHLYGRPADGVRPRIVIGVPDSDHNWRITFGHWHRRHGPIGAAQRAGRRIPGRRRWKPQAT